MGALITDEQKARGKKLSAMESARLMVKAMPKAGRVAEFIGMWAITKSDEGATTVEKLAVYWDEPVRTVYRRLEEFREVWGPAGFDTPDRIADGLIAEYRGRQERLTARDLVRLFSAQVSAPVSASVTGAAIPV